MVVFEHDRVRFHYEVTGGGRLVVFCHGLGGDLSQPKELIGSLPSHQLIVWDSRGHGQTKPVGPEDKFSFHAFAEDLGALLEHLGVSRAVVGGISMGAGVAARFAIRWPQRVEGLVLVRPAWLDQPMPENLRLLACAGELLGEMDPDEALAAFEENKATELEVIRRISEAAADSLRQQFTKPGAAERRVRLVRMPESTPITNWGEASKLTMPALVVGNNRDPAHPYEFAKAWADHLQRAELVHIPSKAQSREGHHRAFREHLCRFLASLAKGQKAC